PGNYVLTLTGPDRIGVVEEVTRLVLDRGGNVEASRMARLGGEFAVLMLVSVAEGFAADFEGLAAEGYRVAVAPASSPSGSSHYGWTPYSIQVEGADHEGIIHEVARHLAAYGISIEEMDSESVPAPTSGVPLFSMRALVLVPPETDKGWADGLLDLGQEMNLDIVVTPTSEDERPRV